MHQMKYYGQGKYVLATVPHNLTPVHLRRAARGDVQAIQSAVKELSIPRQPSGEGERPLPVPAVRLAAAYRQAGWDRSVAQV